MPVMLDRAKGIQFSDDGKTLLKYNEHLSCEIYAVPLGVVCIGKGAFLGCSNLVTVILPQSVSIIESNAFCECTALKNIIIPDSVTEIGNGAFSMCTGLTDITIPDNVTNISNGMFQECCSLASIVIPDGIKSIGENAFSGCTGLIDVIMPEGLTKIGGKAFCNCSNLVSVSIPEDVEDIGDGAFYACTGLESIDFPRELLNIGECAFYGCIQLKKIDIPYAIDEICDNTFYGCTGLKDVTISKSVKCIGKSAFYGCIGLTSISIPDCVSVIYDKAFYGCKNLLEIVMYNRHVKLGVKSFWGVPGWIGQPPMLPDFDEIIRKFNLVMVEQCDSRFWMGKMPVSQGLWKSIMGDNPSEYKKGDDYPVERVSWEKIQQFLLKINEKYEGVILEEYMFDLPTVEQWKFAFHGGGKQGRKSKYAGSDELSEVGWFDENSGGHPHPVGQKKPNALGLYDMSGNVWEWCSDTYEDGHNNERCLCGGSWKNDALCCQVKNCGHNTPKTVRNDYGFRLVLVHM